MVETWKKMCQLLKLTDLDEDECKDWTEVKKEFTNEFLTELESYYQYDLSDLVNYFMFNTFELIANCPNNKQETVK